MVEKTNGVLIVGRFVISGKTAEIFETISELFTWDKLSLIESLADMYDPDYDDEVFTIEVVPEEPDDCNIAGVYVVIDPKDVINLDDLDPYEWTPVSVFTKMCNKDHVYGYKDVLFAQWGNKPSGDITGDNTRYALGFFGYDLGEEERHYRPFIKASQDRNFKPTYCKLIRY